MKKNLIILFGLWANLSLAQSTGAKYLIITPNNFYDAVQPLAQWKQKKGMPAKIVTLSQIGATAESISRIKNYIVNAYNTWTPRPEYVLIVGSPEYIRTDNNYYDDFYANMTGDYHMEIALGRFPDSTVSQCSVTVAKTLSYERTPYISDTLWYKNGTCIIREDGTAHPDTVYWDDSRYICSLWQNAGFVHADTFSKLLGDSANDVIQAINDGRVFVSFRGQGVNNWWQPFWLDLEQTNNGFKLPIVVSGTCATMNLGTGGAFLGDNFLRIGTVTNPKGAVAFVGTSVSATGPGLSALRGVVSKSLFNAIFIENIYKLGDALKRAKFVADSIHLSGWTSTRYREWNMLGDPELSVWTRVPKLLTVLCETVINQGSQTYNVTVRQGTNPVNNALVCIMMDTLIYQYNYTNIAGNVTFLINPLSSGIMSITVTAQNFRPWEGIARIRAAGIEENYQLSNTNYQLKVIPNPIKERTTIHYVIQVSGKVSIKLYNTTGRLINTLLDEYQNAGVYSLNIDNGKLRLPRGVYMLVVKVGEHKFLGKIIKK
jgi:hypothetical protein